MRVHLTGGETLLVDWVLCYPVGCVDPDYLEWLLDEWGELRRELWWKLGKGNPQDTGIRAILDLDGNILERLLAMVPTTFRWGLDGHDVGYSLKMKIMKALGGEDADETESGPQGGAQASGAT